MQILISATFRNTTTRHRSYIYIYFLYIYSTDKIETLLLDTLMIRKWRFDITGELLRNFVIYHTDVYSRFTVKVYRLCNKLVLHKEWHLAGFLNVLLYSTTERKWCWSFGTRSSSEVGVSFFFSFFELVNLIIQREG